MEAKSIAKFQRLSSRRIGLVLDQVRSNSVKKALDVLPFVEKRTAELVYKTVRSAAANLEVKAGKKLDLSKVYIKEAFANMGPGSNLRRIQPGPQGRALPYRKNMAHLTVVVSDERGGK